MGNGDLLILRGAEIDTLCNGCEQQLIECVRTAYLMHAQGQSSLPPSTFLRFKDNDKDRIIALPAYLGGKCEVAGVKWIASFPDNTALGLDRASAVIVLNSMQTGVAEAMLEGSIISAKRTAASAALAAETLSADQPIGRVGLIGCGVINFEIIRFLLATSLQIRHISIWDTQPSALSIFHEKCRTAFPQIEICKTCSPEPIFESCKLISLATTASRPHISDVSMASNGTVFLHISLRDFSPEVILESRNIVDDVDHVCRAGTSLDLAAQVSGNRKFIDGTLPQLLCGATPQRGPINVTIFSPFGLGILDIAVGAWLRNRACQSNTGTVIPSFVPRPWRAIAASSPAAP